MSDDCYQQLAESLKQGAAVLAIVTDIRGSVPREVGAKMIIDANGRTCNTIGGGAGEAKVVRQALTVLETGKKQFVEIDLSGTPSQKTQSGQETQGVCGGWMQVWLERWSGEQAIALVNQILGCYQSGQRATLVIPFAANQYPALVYDPSLLSSTLPAFIEPLQFPPTLLIVGAGHIGEQLAKIADFAGFQIMVQDDRPDWANPQRYPQATMIFNGAIASTLDQIAALPNPLPDLLPNLYVAIVTRGYQYDLEVLQTLLRHNLSCKYIGMIGSKKRIHVVYQELQRTGILPEQLKNIYAPIGIELGALTPEEIAVSICAELIQIRRNGTGESMSAETRRMLAKSAKSPKPALEIPAQMQQKMQQQ